MESYIGIGTYKSKRDQNNSKRDLNFRVFPLSKSINHGPPHPSGRVDQVSIDQNNGQYIWLMSLAEC